MAKFEILCVTMNQNDFSKIEEMNIHTDVVFANQCDHTSYEEFEFEGHKAKMISTETRGVGINRNFSLAYASADVCLLADDDVTYHNDIEARVVAEFNSHPDADVIIFHLSTDDPVRKQVQYSKTQKWSRLRGIPWGGVRIAFRLNSVKRANIWFTSLFGGGTIFPSGEDSIFLLGLRKAGLTFYVSKETIGKVSFDSSSWFTGRDEKYFFALGAFYGAMHTKTSLVRMVYFAFKIRNSKLSFIHRMNWMIHGQKAYYEMLSYDEYIKRLELTR